MPLPSERLAGWLATKWLVGAAALAAFGLLLNHDLRLGIAAGGLLGVICAVWLYLALRYGSLSGAPSVRSAFVESARQHERNRRSAVERSGDPAAPSDRP